MAEEIKGKIFSITVGGQDMMSDRPTAKGSILVYTRTPVPNFYSSHLAYSVHMAYSSDGTIYQALNQNYGILFVKATIAADNTLNEKGLKKPYLFHTADGGFGIVAIRVNADGSRDEESKGKAVLFTSRDLFHFTEVGLLDLHRDAYLQKCLANMIPGKNDVTKVEGRAGKIVTQTP